MHTRELIEVPKEADLKKERVEQKAEFLSPAGRSLSC